MPYIGVTPQFGVRRKHTYTATAGQTSFSGAGAEGTSLSYADSNFVDVYQNGIKLGDADYTSTSGTAIVLAQGASVDDLVEIIVFDAFSAADTVSKADGGTFDGNVTMAGTLAVTGNVTMAGTLNVTGDTTLSNIAGGIVFNEGSADVDFRVESNNNANMLVVNGGSNLVGIGDDPDLGEGLHIKQGDSGATANTSSDNLVIESSGTAGINILTGSGGNAVIDFGDSADNNIGRLIYNHTDNAMLFYVNASERILIDSDGRVYFNTTSALGTGVLQVKLAGTNKAVGIRMRAENAGNWMIAFENSSGTVVGQIIANASSTSYNTSSDHRLKENVTYDFDATTRLKQLKPARFNFIADADTTVDGFLAHEVSSIVPEAVNGEKDAVDADGNIDPQGIDQSKIVPLLTKALQEQQATIEALEARITALENAE